MHNALLRAIGKDSGAHIYLETDDLIHAAKNLLLVHANSGGIKQICLPRKVEYVFDFYTGREISQNCRRFSLRMKQYETRFLFTGRQIAAKKIKAAMATEPCM